MKQISLCLTTITLAVSALVAASAPAQAQAQAQYDPNKPWIMPFDTPSPLNSQTDVYHFMWRTFEALNWPQLANGQRGEPDPTGSLAPWTGKGQSEGPVVWQLYRRPGGVFTPAGGQIDWNDPASIPNNCPAAAPGTTPMVLDSSAIDYSQIHADGLNQPFIQAHYPTGPVTDQNGNYLRYEVGMNRSYFEYVKRFGYWDPVHQAGVVKNFIAYVEANGHAPKPDEAKDAKYFQALPTGTEGYLNGLKAYAHQGVTEWKAAWRILTESDSHRRYYRRLGYLVDPNGDCTGPHMLGLVGFHIHRVLPGGRHIGTTFEQVDNVLLQQAYSDTEIPGSGPLPKHASLNPGREMNMDYANGYEVCDSDGRNCHSGQANLIPAPIKAKQALPAKRPITNISRVVPIPKDVAEVNRIWSVRLKNTAFFYYQMIGTQNGNIEPNNRNLGPGVTGAQASNTNNLINTTLESYTQKGWSCAFCHQNAFPLGVEHPLPPFAQEYQDLRTISFLLQHAKQPEN